jgi:hypothetical protein
MFLKNWDFFLLLTEVQQTREIKYAKWVLARDGKIWVSTGVEKQCGYSKLNFQFFQAANSSHRYV